MKRSANLIEEVSTKALLRGTDCSLGNLWQYSKKNQPCQIYTLSEQFTNNLDETL
jgi:hypothetical protein